MNDEFYRHKLKLVNVRIPCEWNNELDDIAEGEKDTKSNILRKLIKEYLMLKSKQNRKKVSIKWTSYLAFERKK